MSNIILDSKSIGSDPVDESEMNALNGIGGDPTTSLSRDASARAGIIGRVNASP